MKKAKLILLNLLFLGSVLMAQSSFQIVLDSIKLLPGDFSISENGDFSGLFFEESNDTDGLFGLNFSFEKKEAIGHLISIDGLNSYDMANAKMEETEDEIVYLFQSHSENRFEGMSLLYVNKKDNSTWVRQFPDSYLGCFLIKEDGVLVINSGYHFNTLQDREAQMVTLDKENGDVKSEIALKFSNVFPLLQDKFTINIEDVFGFDDGSLIVGGHFANTADRNFFLAKIDPDGNFINQKIYSLVYGKYSALKPSPDGHTYCVTSYRNNRSGPCENYRSVAIQKYDKNLNLLWSKFYDGRRMWAFEADIGFLDDSKPVLFYGGIGGSGSIVAVLDTAGNVLSEKGIYTNDLLIAEYSDSAFVMQSGLVWNGTVGVSPKTIITKVDYLGKVSNCKTYFTQLTTGQAQIDHRAFSADKFTFSDSYLKSATLTPVEFSISEYCEPRLEPGEFIVSDTLCVGDTIRTLSSYPDNINCLDWTLEGPGVNVENLYTEEFFYVVERPGTYTLTQTSVFIGNEYTFEKIIEVVPTLEIEILHDSLLCDLPPTELSLESSSPLVRYLWGNGDTTATTFVYESGLHTVEAESKYCKADTTTSFKYFFEKIDTTLALEVPREVLACKANLPFELRPTSPHSDIFYKNGVEPDSVLVFEAPGKYQISTEVLGCFVTRDFFLELDDCKVNVYVPSAFSPNNDGLNDDFMPLGSQFVEPLFLEVYDRWGGKVFESTKSQLAWDGKHNGKPVSKGVYVFHFKYKNLLTELEEELSGDVMVVR